MSLTVILLLITVVALVGVLPAWPHSRRWGFGPSGILGLVFVALLVTVLARGGA